MAAQSEEVEAFRSNASDGSVMTRRGRGRGRRRRAVFARNIIDGAGQVTDFVKRQSNLLEVDVDWYKDQVTHDSNGQFC